MHTYLLPSNFFKIVVILLRSVLCANRHGCRLTAHIPVFRGMCGISYSSLSYRTACGSSPLLRVLTSGSDRLGCHVAGMTGVCRTPHLGVDFFTVFRVPPLSSWAPPLHSNNIRHLQTVLFPFGCNPHPVQKLDNQGNAEGYNGAEQDTDDGNIGIVH